MHSGGHDCLRAAHTLSVARHQSAEVKLSAWQLVLEQLGATTFCFGITSSLAFRSRLAWMRCIGFWGRHGGWQLLMIVSGGQPAGGKAPRRVQRDLVKKRCGPLQKVLEARIACQRSSHPAPDALLSQHISSNTSRIPAAAELKNIHPKKRPSCSPILVSQYVLRCSLQNSPP